jgi:hypothetical protein
MEVLEFIFSSFWVWLGTIILIGAVLAPVATILRGIVQIHHHHQHYTNQKPEIWRKEEKSGGKP